MIVISIKLKCCKCGHRWPIWSGRAEFDAPGVKRVARERGSPCPLCGHDIVDVEVQVPAKD